MTTARTTCSRNSPAAAPPAAPARSAPTGQVMGYFDGNTVTAFWNYAQHFAMSDNAWTDTFGPSTPGALEVISRPDQRRA